MKKTRSTKSALMLSALSLLLCVSMLVGSTFAWFTDSVTSTNNIIKSGNLDVELYYSTDLNPEAGKDVWTEVDANTNIFGETLWEPGKTQVVYFQIKNAGTLALKYNLGVNVANETAPVKSIGGNMFQLSDYIMFGLTEAALSPMTEYATREAARTAVGSKATKLNVPFNSNGTLLPAEENKNVHYLAMVVYMPETVGNEANYDKDQVAPQINLGINLFATQLTHENDSYGPDYDKGAAWTGAVDTTWYENNATATEFEIASGEELAGLAQLVNGGNTFKGKTIKLAGNINLNGLAWTPIVEFGGTFDGQGYIISNLYIEGTSHVAFFDQLHSTSKVQNVTFDNANVTGEHYVAVVSAWEGNESANLLIKNVKVTNSKVTGKVANNDNGDKIGAIVGYAVSMNLEDCSVENTTVTGYRDVGGIIGYAHKKVVATNNTITDSFVICDASVNYKNYTQADEYDVEAIVGEAVSTAIFTGNTSTNVNVVTPGNVASVGTAADLQAMLTQFTSSGSGDNVLNITSDIDIGSVQWESVTVQGYTGADVITVNGNGHTITGLNAPLFTGGFAGGSGIIIKDLTIKNANFDVAAKYESTGVGAFICSVDSMDVITLTNCHLLDSKITGSRTGGLVGWTSGYNNVNDGPVDTFVTIKNCSVINCEITGTSVGAITGHAGANAATFSLIEDCIVKDNTLTSNSSSYRVGIVVGTANAGQLTINNISESGNTVKQMNGATEIARPAGQSPLYGRFVPAGTGTLTIDGVAIN